jgi:hypothetical protein
VCYPHRPVNAHLSSQGPESLMSLQKLARSFRESFFHHLFEFLLAAHSQWGLDHDSISVFIQFSRRSTHLGPAGAAAAAAGAAPAGAAAADDDEVPSLVGNFEDASKSDAGSAAAK